MRTKLSFALLALCLAAPAFAQTTQGDPYIWLEDVSGARSMEWVHAENAKTLGVLEQDPRFATLNKEALEVAQSKDRIATPSLIAGQVFNFWRDADHTRGIWRRTSVDSYRSATPQWTTVIDLDALSTQEHANWVWDGAYCEEPAEQRCMIVLSDGGEDATTQREFDLHSQAFVAGGFFLPHSKQNADWLDDDTLLVAREWKPGEVTASGYPYIVKKLKRGQPLDSAQEVFRGTTSDVSVAPSVMHDGDGHKAVLLRRAVSFFEAERYLMTPRGLKKLSLPLKSTVSALVDGQLIISLSDAWTVGSAHFGQGSLLSVDLSAATFAPEHLKPVAIYTPTARQSSGEIETTRNALIVTYLDSVKGRAAVYQRRRDGSWRSRALDLPDNASIDPVDGDLHGDRAFLSVTSFLVPTSMWEVDAPSGTLRLAKSLPAQFDASREVVEQAEATSTDGTKIPYFVVHPASMVLDGTNPTVLYAYGGFQDSITPYYSATLGKLWLERSGVFVVANIRGGGEFGPAWHDAGLKTQRQRVFDDFAAVGKDLIARRITSPSHLGIQGGSNGGLLMGVEFVQHPDLWGAVDIQVPLLDMIRFEQIAAGASWVGEYGSVSIPEEKAFLASISPYANLKKGVAYPEPFVWTTTKDDRVGPQHARKFAARLSEYNIPYLFYEVVEGGHGAGANQIEKARTNALEWTYFSEKLMGP